ncbi:hypothetical protein AOLI_G00115530 [Acnodon oligacanthus]
MESEEASRERMSHSGTLTRDSETIHGIQGALKEQDSSLKSDAASPIGDPEPGENVMDLPTGQDHVQMLEAPLDPSHGLHGVLRYRRESQETRISEEPQPSSDQSAWCEFCGATAKPPLDSFHGEEPKEFCCQRYREVFEEVAQERRFVLKLCEERPRGTIGAGDFHSSVEEGLELEAGEWESEERRLQQREMERFYREAQARLSSEISSFHTQTINFQLSSCVPVEESLAVKKDSRKEDKPEPSDWNDPSVSGPMGFGLHNQQDSAGFIQKFYSNGNKFLTGFPDGSAQVFYPSGNLAIILLTNEERVCVIQDDITPNSPMRALFQSSGRATCYHSNGGVWLNMDMWGGQSLDEGGARTRRWSWSDHAQTPTPFRPIFLSLNKNVGVRVLGRQHVFVSFLASGQQARFSVGSCVKPKDYDSLRRGPSPCEEELILLACQFYLRLTLTRLRWCHRFPSSPRHRNIKPSPVLLSLAKKLLSVSHNMHMKDTDRTFIQHCLQDCQRPQASGTT